MTVVNWEERLAVAFTDKRNLQTAKESKKALTSLMKPGDRAEAPNLGAIPTELGEVMFHDSLEGELAWQVLGGH